MVLKILLAVLMVLTIIRIIYSVKYYTVTIPVCGNASGKRKAVEILFAEKWNIISVICICVIAYVAAS